MKKGWRITREEEPPHRIPVLVIFDVVERYTTIATYDKEAGTFTLQGEEVTLSIRYFPFWQLLPEMPKE